MKKFLLLVFISIAIASHAQDRYFATTYTSNVLPKDAIDLEFYHTSRIGHLHQYYHGQDQRMEIEIGLGNSWQTAFYFNRYQERFSISDTGTQTNNEIGFSNEWKWKLLSQNKNGIGLALYSEWGIKGGDELELETKIILDKWMGKHLFAFNALTEYEREFAWLSKSTRSDGWELPVQLDLAYMYTVRPQLGIGFEIVNYNGISKDQGWEHSALFGGPTINYRGNGWFAIVNFLPQWKNLHKTNIAPYNKVLDEHERRELRIAFGVTLR